MGVGIVSPCFRVVAFGVGESVLRGCTRRVCRRVGFGVLQFPTCSLTAGRALVVESVQPRGSSCCCGGLVCENAWDVALLSFAQIIKLTTLLSSCPNPRPAPSVLFPLYFLPCAALSVLRWARALRRKAPPTATNQQPPPQPPLTTTNRLISNRQVRRFERFVLGEGLEKKVSDLAADVAAATGKA